MLSGCYRRQECHAALRRTSIASRSSIIPGSKTASKSPGMRPEETFFKGHHHNRPGARRTLFPSITAARHSGGLTVPVPAGNLSRGFGGAILQPGRGNNRKHMIVFIQQQPQHPEPLVPSKKIWRDFINRMDGQPREAAYLLNQGCKLPLERDR